jgi:hypothetical protein
MEKAAILARQLKAARALAQLDQQMLADRAGLSIPTIKRMEAGDGPVRGNYENVAAVVAALEAAGIEFTNGGQPGVRLRIVGAWPAQRNSTGEWGVATRWKIGDPIEWAPIEVARVAAAQAQQEGAQRVADTLCRAADDAARYALGSIPPNQLKASNDE